MPHLSPMNWLFSLLFCIFIILSFSSLFWWFKSSIMFPKFYLLNLNSNFNIFW